MGYSKNAERNGPHIPQTWNRLWVTADLNRAERRAEWRRRTTREERKRLECPAGGNIPYVSGRPR